MKPAALVAAIAAAAAGAGSWAAVSYFMDLELGWLAWGIGGMVGGAAYGLGGRGPASGGIAAALVLASILGGKMLAVDAIIGRAVSEKLTLGEYREQLSDAEAFPGIEDRERLRSFIIEHEFSEKGTEEEIDSFLVIWAPELEKLRAENPDFETWRAQQIDRRKELVYSQSSRIDFIQESLGLIDLIFAALGVSTAFKLAGRPEAIFTGGDLDGDEDLDAI